MEKMSIQILSPEEMAKIEGGSCTGLAFACGAGIALSTLTGGLGAILYGPSTIGLCAGAYNAC